MGSHAIKVPLLHHESSWVLCFPIDGACQVSQLTRVKLRFPIGRACQVSHLTQGKLCFLIGSACQVSQIKQVKLCFPIGSACPLKKTNAFTFRLIVGCFDPFNSSWDFCQSTNAEMIATTSKSINALPFCGKSITFFGGEPVSTFQFVIASSFANNFIHEPTFQFIVESKQNANLQTTTTFDKELRLITTTVASAG